jgi:tetratricopeptide (TPR) repeat protein
MKTRILAALALLGLLGAPLFAQDSKKIDDAVRKANEQLAKGKPEDARKTLEKLRDQFPSSADANGALGDLLTRMGEFEAAGAAFEQGVRATAASSAEEKSKALAHLANFELRTKAGKDALAHAEQAFRAAPTPFTQAALARAQARVGDGPSALKSAEAAVQGAPQSAGAYEALSRALFVSGRDKDAEAAARKAIQLDASNVDAHIRLALALGAQGKNAEAVAAARKATELDPQSGEAYAILGLAILRENKNNWNDAIAQAQQGRFLNPANPVVQVAVARIFEAAGNHDQAALAYAEALKSDPGYAEARMALVQTRIWRGDLDAALNEAKQLVKEAPQSGEGQLMLGKIYLRKNDYASALEPLSQAAKYLPGSAEAQALYGESLFYNGKAEEALPPYKRAVELDPKNLAYQKDYAFVLGQAGNPAEGVAVLEKVVASPGYDQVTGYIALGELLLDVDPPRPDDAIKAFDTALKIDPKSVRAAIGRGDAYFAKKAWDQVIPAYEKAAQLEPKVADKAYTAIAWAYLAKKEIPKAKAAAETARKAGWADTRIFQQIELFEKAQAAGTAATEEAIRAAEAQRQEAARYAQLIDQLNTGGPAQRKRAVQELPKVAGREAVDALAYALHDKSADVREAACMSLGSLGSGAKKAVPAMMQIITTREENVFMNEEQMKQMLRDEDVRRACKEAVARINR